MILLRVSVSGRKANVYNHGDNALVGITNAMFVKLGWVCSIQDCEGVISVQSRIASSLDKLENENNGKCLVKISSSRK